MSRYLSIDDLSFMDRYVRVHIPRLLIHTDTHVRNEPCVVCMKMQQDVCLP